LRDDILSCNARVCIPNIEVYRLDIRLALHDIPVRMPSRFPKDVYGYQMPLLSGRGASTI
jgi:hypothetical protein